MHDGDEFIDYYEVLQVDPRCDIKIIEGAYRHFAKIYHPDHQNTSNASLFALVVDAYNTLKFAEKRAEYDTLYYSKKKAGPFVLDTPLGSDTALSDATMQQNILLFLYKRKRENFAEAGVGAYYIQQHFGCTDDNFEFHIWYLKSKGYVEITERGTLSITVMGVDHVISLHQRRSVEKLLTDQSHDPEN